MLGRKTVEYMTSDQLGPEVDIDKLKNFPNLNGYGFGLSVAVRRGAGISGIMGSPGDFNWGRRRRHVLLGRPQGGIDRRAHGKCQRSNSYAAGNYDLGLCVACELRNAGARSYRLLRRAIHGPGTCM